MTKVIVQIPCHNEVRTIARTVSDIPRRIPGVDTVEVLIIDDGSTDDTSGAAWEAGADHVIRHTVNKGRVPATITASMGRLQCDRRPWGGLMRR